MERRPLVEYLLTDGIHTSGVKSVERTSTMAKGSKNVIMTGFDKPNAYKGTELLSGKNGARVMMPVGESYGGIGAYGDKSALGSMTRMFAVLFYSGSGAVFYDGLPLGDPGATSVLQLRVLENGVWSAAYNAGLAAPSSAVIAARDTLGAGMTGRNKNGTYSVRITKIRSATGTHSNASETSNLVVVSEVDGKGKSIRVTFPPIGTNGADAWGLYVSPKNFGSTGPHFLLREILESELTTIDNVPRSFEIEWTDGDLVGSTLAPIESNEPPTCVFNGALGDAFFLDGCYGDIEKGVSAGAPGSTIVMSLPGRPEEFPADSLLFPPEPPTALIRGGEGFYYRFGKNSMGVVSYTGGTPPLNFQLYWATVGITYPHNACVAEGGRLYAKTGARGICRIVGGGEIDASFANDVIDEFGDWLDEDTVLGWDEHSQNVCFMNNTDVWCF
ncbi:MAG TPA: hypothetical protein VNI84_15090, partial [Pyrinomonadaceae bacterium]|nr:hypothetical protein [Pyrinomonadaceae bacterium]